MNQQVSLISAFVAGLLSFLSPCVLPLVPAYLSFLTGMNIEKIEGEEKRKARVWIMWIALGFVLGFSLVFITLGASATLLGRWLIHQAMWISKAGGVVLVVFGLHLMGVFKIPFLMMEQRMHQLPRRSGFFSAVLVGSAFAFGWSPCIGPILAGILALAGTQETIGQGIGLLTVYSFGLAIPFLLTAFLLDRFIIRLKKIQKYFKWIELAAGLLLITLGLVLILGKMMQLSSVFTFMMPFAK